MSFEITKTELDGILVVRPRIHGDARGFFYESYHRAKFAQLGIRDEFVQDNHSRSTHGVLRGLHYQDQRAPMAKLVRCTTGRVLDVAVDLRVGAPTFGRHVAIDLSAENCCQIYIPSGFAHGFVVLSDVAEVLYKCSGFYDPKCEGAIRWNDPDLAIPWPITSPTLSDRDRAAPSLREYRARPAFLYST